MNRQINRLFLVFVALFGVLVGFSSCSTVLRANHFRNSALNRRPLLEQQRIPRGLIFARDGTRLAINRRIGSRDTRRFVRVYPTGGLFSHAVGYAFVSHGSSGLEKSKNDALQGNENDVRSLFQDFIGGPQEGDDVHTTLDPRAQRTALSGLAGRPGSIVALDPSTGAVRVMASVPGYDPNQVPGKFPQLNSGTGSPLFNRATQARYPPGSTFKVVTAAAALDTGKYTPDSVISGKNGKLISGVPLQNFGGENFGSISLTDALTHSVNTVFGEVGEKLGKGTMLKYMRRFGFNANPQLDYPANQMTPSGVFSHGNLLNETNSIDIGRVAIGQERLQVTPLQMAEVAAAVGNGGKLMRPHLVDKVVSPDGRVRETVRPEVQSTVMSQSAAGQLTRMMENVVQSGTGTAAQLQGIQVAGKTGTAEVPGGQNQAWFIAFAPSTHPTVAVAVTVERTQQSFTGGEVAAPLAAQVMRVLLSEHG
jgi:peptidoglycan glycosyltransferase